MVEHSVQFPGSVLGSVFSCIGVRCSGWDYGYQYLIKRYYILYELKLFEFFYFFTSTMARINDIRSVSSIHQRLKSLQ